MAGKKRILYLYAHPSTFVKKDIAFLGEHYPVTSKKFVAYGSAGILTMFVRQFFYFLGNLRKVRVIFVMFGGSHAFMPALMGRLLGKKVFIILGGSDCVSFPSINYGNFRKRSQAWLTCKAYRWAYRLVPVHESLMERHDTFYEAAEDPKGQGAYFHCPGLKEKTPFTAIHNGYEPEKWDNEGVPKQAKTFITVTNITDRTQILLKGIDLIEEVAERFPDCQFTIVGFQEGAEAFLKKHPNMICIPYIKPEELKKLFAESQFYLQISISEGFPNALAEAMLSRCIPIGSPVAGIPDIMGDTGLMLETKNSERFAEVLDEALALPDKPGRGQAAREHIASRFSLDKRKQAYLDLVREHLD